MPSSEVFLGIVLYVQDGEVTDDAVERVLDKMTAAALDENLDISGAISRDTLKNEEGEQEAENQCPTCGGYGFLDPEEMVEPLPEDEWEDLYGNQAPVAQVDLEHPPPKGKVEGSSPSRSANVRIRRDREDTGEARGQDIPSDDRGNREGREDPRGNTGSENG